MKLYHIQRKSKCSFDEVDAFIVAAKDSGKARTLASRKCCDEGPQTWLSSAKSTSVCVGTASARVKEGVLLTEALMVP